MPAVRLAVVLRARPCTTAALDRDRAALAAGISDGAGAALPPRGEAGEPDPAGVARSARIGVRATLRYAIGTGRSWPGNDRAIDDGRRVRSRASIVAGMKVAEVTLHGSRLDALSRWVVMPRARPRWSCSASRSPAGGWLVAPGAGIRACGCSRGGARCSGAHDLPRLAAVSSRYIFLYVVCCYRTPRGARVSAGRRRSGVGRALALRRSVGLQAVGWSREATTAARSAGSRSTARRRSRRCWMRGSAGTWSTIACCASRATQAVGCERERDGTRALRSHRAPALGVVRPEDGAGEGRPFDRKRLRRKVIFDPSSRSYHDAERAFRARRSAIDVTAPTR